MDNLLTTATYNIHHGRGNDQEVNLDRIAEAIANFEPDVVALQENDIVNGRTDFVNQPQVIAEKLSQLTGLDWEALEAPAIEFSGGEYGNAILYNDDILDLEEFQNVLLPGNPEGDGQRSAGIATFEFEEIDFQFVATHFTNLNEPTEGDSTIQLESLEIIDNSVSGDLPVILAGDLNADINPALRDGELVDVNPETIEELQNLGYEIVSLFDDESDTVPSENFDGVIDYIAIKNGENFEVKDGEIVINDLTDLASDHYPVTATFSLSSEFPSPRNEAVPFTHAHNDYEHEFPLFEALSYGFISVESDIWLYPDDNGNLRVAHDPVEDPATLPTIEELYLDPLQDLKEEFDNGGIYADGTPLNLLIDIKSEGLPTYQRLHEVLSEYQEESPGLFTTYTQDEMGNYTVTPGAVTAIISGDRPRDFMESQEVRYAGYDGRKDDIGTDVSPGFMPLISDNWNNFFTDDLAWDGTGTIPEDTSAELNRIVSEVQAEDKIFRFWNLPQDGPSVWGPLYEAGIDLINTDDLAGLSTFIQSQLSSGTVVEGTDDRDLLMGTPGEDTIAGLLGDDEIEGLGGDDILRGDLNERSPGGSEGGNDTINGGEGDDQIGGKGGHDELYGDAGNDSIWGDDGDDLLRGGLGDDVLTGDDFSGGEGVDTFVLAAGEGIDTITDFEIGIDAVELFGDLIPENLTIEQREADTVISLDDEVLGIFNGVDAVAMAAANPFI